MLRRNDRHFDSHDIPNFDAHDVLRLVSRIRLMVPSRLVHAFLIFSRKVNIKKQIPPHIHLETIHSSSTSSFFSKALSYLVLTLMKVLHSLYFCSFTHTKNSWFVHSIYDPSIFKHLNGCCQLAIVTSSVEQ